MGRHRPEHEVPITIPNFQTGKYLDHSEYGMRAIAPNGGVYQKWWVTRWSDDTREIRNHATGKCVEVNTQSQLIGVACDKSRRQSWYIIKNDYSVDYGYLTRLAHRGPGRGLRLPRQVLCGPKEAGHEVPADVAAGPRGPPRTVVR